MALLELELSFLVSKKMGAFLFIFMASLTLAMLYNSNCYLGRAELDLDRVGYYAEYLANSLEIVKFVSVLLSIMLSSQACSQKSRIFDSYLIEKPGDKGACFIAKVTALTAVIFMFVAYLFICFVLIGKLLTPYEIDVLDNLHLFGLIGIQSLCFALFQSFLMLVFKHDFTLILPLVALWVMELYSSSMTFGANQFVKLLYEVFPNLIFYHDRWRFVNPATDYLIVFMITLAVSYLVSLLQDL